MRYELKMTFNVHLLPHVLNSLYSSPLGFKEIFHERKVNNIYFDTLDFHDFNTNMDGLFDRSKFRVRWYGEETHFYPVLEEKIKKGELGYKRSVNFKELTTKEAIITHHQTLGLDSLEQSQRFYHRQPTLINSYLRKYYMSMNSKIRATLDRNISFAHPLHHTHSINLHDLAVLELKFEQEDYKLVQDLVQHLNIRFDKNSKYVVGVNHIYFA